MQKVKAATKKYKRKSAEKGVSGAEVPGVYIREEVALHRSIDDDDDDDEMMVAP